MAKNTKKDDDTQIAQNRRAYFEYEILEKIEAGLVLTGVEVKSLRLYGASLNEGYAGVKDGAIYLFNMHISEYKNAKNVTQEPRRPRKLLLHKREENKLLGAVQKKGMTLIPLALYFNKRGLAKCLIGLGKGKKLHDKRETEKNRDWDRQKQRLMAAKNT